MAHWLFRDKKGTKHRFSRIWITTGIAVSAAAGLSCAANEQRPVGPALRPARELAPAYRTLNPAEQQIFDRGHEVFDRTWTRSRTDADRVESGLGPLFNARSCGDCHEEGARGHGPVGDGPAPTALVMQLGSPEMISDPVGLGDPIYGHVLNTQAQPGVAPEARLALRYLPLEGRYPDGSVWRLRRPQYVISGLAYGPLARSTVLKPRLAPQIFGVGLLEEAARAVPQVPRVVPLFAWDSSAAGDRDASRLSGRFGWQSKAFTVSEQTTLALSRELGVASSDVPTDDCTPLQAARLHWRGGQERPASDDAIAALVEFQRWLAVPRSSGNRRLDAEAVRSFERAGCARCHTPVLPLASNGSGEGAEPKQIQPFTDLQVHDMGEQLADHDVGGRSVRKPWRTPPLWGIGYALRTERDATFLHDGRARSVEEAILWHDGEARAARLRFEKLPAKARAKLLRWVESL
jgi:CxxC motif-containing protein (DUF1111 family)